MSTLKALIKKEFLQIIRDPSSIIIAFVLPLISILIYMYGINLDTVKVTIGIKNDDANPEIATLVKSFGHSKYVNSIVYDNEKELEEGIVRSRLKGAVIIPNDFSTNLSRSKTAEVLIITDGSEVNTANYVQNYSMQIINQWLASSRYNNSSQKPRVNSTIRTWYNQDLNSHYFILPGSVAITMTLIGILLTALVVAREREMGTFDQLIVSPLTSFEILLGKTIPPLVIAMCLTCIMTVIVITAFKIPFMGSFLLFFVSIFISLLSIVGVGLFISSICKTQQQAILGVITFQMPAILLSGFISPIEDMPKFLQYLTLINPIRFFMLLTRGIFLKGMSFHDVFINWIPLILIATITLSLAMLTFKRKLD